MIAIDKPTDMAAVQITTSRKLGILVGKMDAGVSGKVAALSVILFQRKTGKHAA
jgi:hypothetical protein